MNRSQSALSAVVGNNKDTNKRSIWGTLRSKRKGNENSSRRKPSNTLHRLSVSSSSMTVSDTASTNHNHSTHFSTGKHTSNNNNNNDTKYSDNDHNHSINNISNNNTTDLRTNNSTSASISSSASSSNARLFSSTTSALSYSLDPNANKDSDSVYSSSRNSVYSMRSTSLPAKAEVDKKNNRFSRIFDSDLFGAEELSKAKILPVNSRERTNNKRHSVMFGKSSVPPDFLKTLQQVPSNEENLIPNFSKETNRLSLTFEDYKLALEVYGDGDNQEIKTGCEDLSSTSSPYITDYEENDAKTEVKFYSNCIWISSCQSFTNFDDNHIKTIVDAKVSKIDITVNEDLDGVFNEDEDDDDNDGRVVQRTSLYFT